MKVDYVNHMGTDLSVVNSARVSFDKESQWENEDEMWISPFVGEVRVEMIDPTVTPILSEDDAKLIRFLAKHEHFSPFNHTYITVRVKAPLFVARQLVKHEYMPWNEVSRRYVSSEPEFYIPMGFRKAADNVKQGSSEELIDVARYDRDDGYENWYEESVSISLEAYKEMINMGVCPEQARMVLPQSMYTEWYWSGTLKAFAKMYNLRIDSHSQKETQEIAQQVGEIIAPLFPVAWKALTDG